MARRPTDYDEVADRYAAGVDERPWNALYERPAMLALLPPVAGKDVLDAGCGGGWYTEWLTEHGARAVGIDRSAKMVEYAAARLGSTARVVCGDAGDLRGTFADASFDLIMSSLVIHYMDDLAATFAEWARVLRPNGWLAFSTHHPGGTERTELVELEWKWLGTTMTSYVRPLRELLDPLAAAGFTVDRTASPSPSEAMRRGDPRGYERLRREPAFVFIRARKL
jgi:SAM-dependent methyltransferase